LRFGKFATRCDAEPLPENLGARSMKCYPQAWHLFT
jgi:hypothetical protein